MRHALRLAVGVALLLTPGPARAQDDAVERQSPFAQFFRDVGGDYSDAFTRTETVLWWGAGGATAGLVHLADEALRQDTEDPNATLTRALNSGGAGATYGNLTLQVPLAIGWWAIGNAAHSQRDRAAGRNLLRAQINTVSWTYAFKYAVNRTRPNGDPRSFPSGHSSAVFATATVLQEHYGWRVGVPVFAAATLTAASRITVNKHWASDVVFGAFVGIASGRTATRLERRLGMTIQPSTSPGAIGVTLSRSGRR